MVDAVGDRPDIWLAEVTAAVDSTGTKETYRWSTGEGLHAPDAPGYYEPRLAQAANLQRRLWKDMRTYGASEVAYGEIVVANDDGAFDDLIGYGYGWEARLLRVPEGGDYADASTVLTGSVEQPEFDLSELRIRIRDRQQELTVSAQTAQFAGTNSGSCDLEGGDDLTGKTKPRVWGVIHDARPAYVNKTSLIYALNFDADGNRAPVEAIDAVYDNAAALARADSGNGSGDFATASDLCNATAGSSGDDIEPGEFATCLAEGLIRLGQGARLVTVDVTEATDNHVASLAERVLLDAGVPSGDISSTDLSDIDSAAPYDGGYYISPHDEPDYRDVLDELASSWGGWYTTDAAGVYRFGQLTDPANETPTATLKRFEIGTVARGDEYDLVSINRQVARDQGRGIPAYRVIVQYDRRWGSIALPAETATEDRKAEVASEYRTASKTDSSVRDVWANSSQITMSTVLVAAADADAEADRRLTIYKKRRDIWEVVMPYVQGIGLGDIVAVDLDRLSLAGGKNHLVIGWRINATTRAMRLTLWG